MSEQTAHLVPKGRAMSRKTKSEQLKALVERAAENWPELEDLTTEQQEAIRDRALVEDMTANMHRRIIAERIDWPAQREAFLADKHSAHTRRAYSYALRILEDWLEGKGLSHSDIDQGKADEFIRDLKVVRRMSKGVERALDADTVRLVVNICSSFYSHLERSCNGEISNPFRGTRARPRSTWAVATIPSSGDVEVFRSAMDPVTRAAMEVIIGSGLRIGGLPELVIREDGTFWTLTKGKRFLGPQPISEAAREALKAAGLDPRRPFSPETFPIDESRRRTQEVTAENIIAVLKMRLQRTCEKLQKAGELSTVFSWHDFRHGFAQANADKGMQWLKAALGHSSISVTEHYLQNTFAMDTRGM